MFLQAGRFASHSPTSRPPSGCSRACTRLMLTLGQLEQQRGRLDAAATAFGRAIERARRAGTGLAASHPGLAPRRPPRRDPQQRARPRCAIWMKPSGSSRAIRSRAAGDHVERARLVFGAASTTRPWPPAARPLALVARPCRGPSTADLVADGPEAVRRGARLVRRLPRREEPTVEVLEIRGLARVAGRTTPARSPTTPGRSSCGPTSTPETRARLLNHRGWAYHFADAPRLALDDFEASLKLTGTRATPLPAAAWPGSAWATGAPPWPTPRRRSAWHGVLGVNRRSGGSRARPTSTRRGSTPRPSSSPPARSAAKASAPSAAIARIAPAASGPAPAGAEASPRSSATQLLSDPRLAGPLAELAMHSQQNHPLIFHEMR